MPFTDKGVTAAALARLTQLAMNTATPYNWGANVFISIHDMREDIERKEAWAVFAETVYLEGVVKPFLILAMNFHRKRILEILDGIDVPEQFQNRGRYGIAKRFGALRIEKTSMLGTLFYVDSTTPLGSVGGDLREGIENAASKINRVNDRSLNGVYTSSISYTEPEYLEAIIRGHRGFFNARNIAELDKILMELGFSNEQIFARLVNGGNAYGGSKDVPPRDFITAAWQDVGDRLSIAWDALIVEADREIQVLANMTDQGDPRKIVSAFRSRVANTVLGFVQRNSNSLISMLNSHVQSVDMFRGGGIRILERDPGWRGLTDGVIARMEEKIRMDRIQSKPLIIIGDTSTTGKGNHVWIIEDRKLIERLILKAAKETLVTDKLVRDINRSLVSIARTSITRTKSLAVSKEFGFHDIAAFIIAKGVMGRRRIDMSALTAGIINRGRQLAREMRAGGTGGGLEEFPAKFPGLFPRDRRAGGRMFKILTGFGDVVGIGGMGGMIGMGSIGLGVRAIGGMGSLGGVGGVSKFGGVTEITGFGQSL